MRIVLTSDWSFDDLAPYTKQITAAMKKMAERFPKDCTVESLAGECLNGSKHLWLILDDEDKFMSFVLTEMRTVDATGHKMISVTALAGDDGLDSTPLIAEIEKWGAENGAKECIVAGRRGWARELKKQGYESNVVLFRKDLEETA